MDIAKIRKRLKKERPDTEKRLIKPAPQEAEKEDVLIQEGSLKAGFESKMHGIEKKVIAEFTRMVQREEDREKLSGEETLQERLETLQKSSVTVAQEIEMVVFRLGNEEYAFRLDTILEILRRQYIIDVPGAPPFLVGITSLRGKVIPIVDLSMRLLGTKVSNSVKNRILVMEGKRGILGCLVDEVIGVVRTSLINKEEPPEHLKEEQKVFIDGIFIIDSRFVTLLKDNAFEF